MMYGIIPHLTLLVVLLVRQCSCQTGGLSGYLTVDNEFVLYADGVMVASDTNWMTQFPLNLNYYPKVLAIFARDRGSKEGIVASFNTGVVSDSNWRCRATNSNPDSDIPGWKNVNYDDSNWPAAHEIVVNGGGTWSFTGSVDVSPAAKWIWTENADRNIVCRVAPTRCLLADLPCSCDWQVFGDIPELPYDGDQYVRVDDCLYTNNNNNEGNFGTQKMACCRPNGKFRLTFMTGFPVAT